VKKLGQIYHGLANLLMNMDQLLQTSEFINSNILTEIESILINLSIVNQIH
jgi:hypothetical protein